MLNNENNEQEADNNSANDVVSPLLTVKQFPKKHEAFSEGGLRHLIFHQNENGFHRCIRRIGRKILIHEKAFFSWLEETNHAQISCSSNPRQRK